MKPRSALALVLVGGLLGLHTSATYAAVTLGDLIDRQLSIIVDDKAFSNFSFDVNTSGVPTIDADSITIDSLSSVGDPNPLDPGPGLRFNIMDDALSVGEGDDLSVTIKFSVTVLDPTLQIKDTYLYHSGASWTGEEDEVFSFALLTILDVTGVQLADSLAVYSPSLGDLPDTDWAEFLPSSSIEVIANLYVEAYFSNTDDNFISHKGFEVHFSQTTVPEPATLALFGLGLAGIPFVRRRRTPA